MARILIADDNTQIIEILYRYATKEGYEVYTATDGVDTLEEYQKRKYDLILLDVMMPGKDGFEICKQIRKQSMVPIIMITARGDDYDRIMGLDIGADDYIVKPFSPSEVMARIRAIFRRVNNLEMKQDNTANVGNLWVNLDKFQAYIGDEEIMLTKKEIEILWLLTSNIGRVFSRSQILDSVWGYDYFGDLRNVDTHIKRLRAKVEKYDCKGWKIVTVRGIGYRLEVVDTNE
ncbi:response regulator transcription factor [Blautia obeum]|uniref:response regulator transcription factor n=1 Tax=Blautia obeum TaxID=40520 RepID=UPI002A8E8766|nr:response regulator transcription factor [Lachnospiraceae bacterium]